MNKVKKNARTNQLVNVSKTPRWQKYVFFFNSHGFTREDACGKSKYDPREVKHQMLFEMKVDHA